MLIEALNIAHSFDYELYNSIDFNLKNNQSIAILGRSGSGKSTLLYNLSSFLKPSHGDIKLLNQDIYNISESDLIKLRRYNIGMIFQSHYLFKGMNGINNIDIARILSNTPQDKKLLEKLEIERVVSQKVSDLSGGQQQRVSIARVLNKQPNIIFADEPTGNLDKTTARLVMKVLLEYISSGERGLVLVTHDEEIANMCDKIYRLEDKKLNEIKISKFL